jgi:HAD superfamily hydrolase (TIGR01509 family)
MANKLSRTESGRDQSSPEPVELVIFDCDGVIVDTEAISIPITAQLIKETTGRAITPEECAERFLGRSFHVTTDFVRENARSPLDTAAWETEWRRRVWHAFRAQLKPVDGIEEVLSELKCATCVASSGDHEKIALTLGLTGLYQRFADRIFSVTEVERGKPAPDLFLYASRQMGVPPTRCAVVEDSPFGVAAGLAAGMRTFGYARLTPAALLDVDGVIVFNDMRRLPALLQ